MNDKITKDRLGTPQAVFSLGMVVAGMLATHGEAALFINESGEAEVIPQGELQLDSYEPEDAIKVLMEKGYDDSRLILYLKGRDWRERQKALQSISTPTEISIQ